LLNEHTLGQLRDLRMDGMVHALADQATTAAAAKMAFEERLAMLVQREIDWRDGKRLVRLLKAAKLKVGSACIEDIDWRGSRGLDRNLVTSLAGCDWLRHAHNVLITGATSRRHRIECRRLLEEEAFLHARTAKGFRRVQWECLYLWHARQAPPPSSSRNRSSISSPCNAKGRKGLTGLPARSRC